MKNRQSSFLRWAALGFVLLIMFTAFISFLVAVLAGSSSGGNIARIKITGVITSEPETLLGGTTATSEQIAGLIRTADENPSIAGIILDINSPGGSAVASEELASAVKQAKKPVVALIRDVGTSGAYWAASSADMVVASPLSITGSVGATASYLEFSGLMGKYGVGYERIVSGEFKDAGSPFRNLTQEETLIMQEIIRQTGRYFAASVQENRNLDAKTMKEVSTARIYTGQQALELNLVDLLGNSETAKEAIKELAGVEEVNIVDYQVKTPFSLAGILSEQASAITNGILSSGIPSRKGMPALVRD